MNLTISPTALPITITIYHILYLILKTTIIITTHFSLTIILLNFQSDVASAQFAMHIFMHYGHLKIAFKNGLRLQLKSTGNLLGSILTTTKKYQTIYIVFKHHHLSHFMSKSFLMTYHLHTTYTNATTLNHLTVINAIKLVPHFIGSSALFHNLLTILFITP